ncbi:hypothetical protein BJ138DRAFT_1168715 [Hygrophoropsis aurantiaca]|uniref:Uncharacterized protein n=1 Tax=Hygrophoropsis aurantiaca TaxID=72124 RepID=A0ACB7ZQ33_9AGAM|nr:hypothetical protein BJ138DRAFT_1168715 [Hygrophoropsis aurantiaca]
MDPPSRTILAILSSILSWFIFIGFYSDGRKLSLEILYRLTLITCWILRCVHGPSDIEKSIALWCLFIGFCPQALVHNHTWSNR